MLYISVHATLQLIKSVYQSNFLIISPMALLSCSPLSSTLHPPASRTTDAADRSSPFHPSVWGDYFMTYSEDHNKIDAWTRKVKELKEEVKRILCTVKGSDGEMMVIDELQRLGVAYHFEKEISEALQRIYDSDVDYDHLQTVALRFRLLRQQGHNVSPDVFCKFKDDKGNFKATLTTDVKGMLSLYEAAFCRTHGEDILDEAIAFTRGQLSSLVAHLDEGPLAAQVSRALELPMHKRVPRLEARFYISIFQQEKKQNDVLLELAKYDFNLVQSLHRKELKEITRWWKNLGLATKYPFSRDRLVEAYCWMMWACFEPQYARARSIATKMCKVVSIVDDIYDVDSTFEEVKVFADAIQRWDLKAMDQLPQYMRPCYLALLNTVEEIEDEFMPGEKFYRSKHLKYIMKSISRVYFKEAQWLNNGHVPTLEEYLKVSLVSAGHLYLISAIYVGVGEEATKETLDWLKTIPKFVLDSSAVGRLLNDVQSNGFEQKRKHPTSSVECYMKEHGVSRQEACEKLREMVALAWNDLNKFCMKPTSLPWSLLMGVINLTRTMEVIYLYGDGYTHSSRDTKEHVISLLIDPIPM